LHDVQSIRVQNAEQSRQIALAVLAGETGPARDIVLLNAGAAIYVAGLVANLTVGIASASRVIDSGDAKNKLQQLIVLSQQMS
jgi:anthranilate phosphoribosyltransferase